MYDSIGDKIFRVLNDEWFPQFVMSDFYKSLNEETIVLNRERSKTMDNYDIYTDFVKGQGKTENNKEKEEKEEKEEKSPEKKKEKRRKRKKVLKNRSKI